MIPPVEEIIRVAFVPRAAVDFGSSGSCEEALSNQANLRRPPWKS